MPSQKKLFWLPGLLIMVSLACNIGVPYETPTVQLPIPEERDGFSETATSLRATDLRTTDRAEMTATAEWATATALRSTDYAQMTADASVATPGPSPTPALVSQARFAPGATDLEIEGVLPAGAAHEHTLRAGAGQIMQASIFPPSSGLVLAVFGADGTVLQSAEAGKSSWGGHLPGSQVYTLRVSGAQEATDYFISVRVPAIIPLVAGSNTATISGTLASEGPSKLVIYSILGQEGRTMSVTVSSPNNNVLLSVTGFEDGQPYLRHVADSTGHTMTLPATQDYLLGVLNISAASTSFTVTVQFTD